MIEVSHVSKHFGNFKAVDDITFSIPTGQIVGLLGPNGAGKTTTMRMITGFWGMTSGSIKIDGQEISDNLTKDKSKIGYMPESAPLYAEMIVEDYLKYLCQIHNQNEDEKISELCQTCGLKEVMDKNISDLSRGYKQCVGLAHALINNPEILILDEPMNGLDKEGVSEIRKLLLDFKSKGKTIIIVSHNSEDINMLCDTVHEMDKGRLVE